MDKKTTALISTIAAVVFCGCPGLFSLCGGAMFAVVSQMPGANIDVMGSSDPQSALLFGLGGLCSGVIMLAIAAGVIILVRRRNAANPQ